MGQRKGGTIQLQVNGTVYLAKGDFSYNLGIPLREEIMGADTLHGYKETPQAAFIEGEITDMIDLDLASVLRQNNVTVTLDLAVGKLFVLSDAFFAGEGTANTGEGNIAVRWVGLGEEIPL